MSVEKPYLFSTPPVEAVSLAAPRIFSAFHNFLLYDCFF
jgi:hypothetical protein